MELPLSPETYLVTRRRYGAAGHRWEVFTQLVFATYGDTCLPGYLCGHGGARTVDHIQPITENPAAVFDLANCRPAHGSTRGRGNACPVCSEAAGKPVNCNSIKGWGSPERARRLISERTGLPMPGDEPAAKPGQPARGEQQQGRDW